MTLTKKIVVSKSHTDIDEIFRENIDNKNSSFMLQKFSTLLKCKFLYFILEK